MMPAFSLVLRLAEHDLPTSPRRLGRDLQQAKQSQLPKAQPPRPEAEHLEQPSVRLKAAERSGPVKKPRSEVEKLPWLVRH